MGDIDRLLIACEVLGNPEHWFRPDGYPDGLALCIIDSIQSTGSHYSSVLNVVRRYRRYRGDAANTDGTAELLATFDACGGVDGWARAIGNQKPASTRNGASLKAAVIQQVARNLHYDGVRTTDDLRARGALEPGNDARRRATKKLWTSVEAQSSGITWNYALMLAGLPGVKADRMVTRFVSRALDGVDLSPEAAASLVREAARLMDVPATDLDHAIWRKESDRPVSVDPDDEQQPVLEEADDVDNRDLNAR
ncbi:heme peroxidase superfamily protein [Mycolicibacterium conceptionense]|uniref:Heme peroxidase superfamily protein n=1 Tax=Mycolicibacterium conceptionense TaxID=451644 RepID=A0A0U1D4R0_9MYCO|nr:heme peroxidase [Mycolicibacterium conceptionense]CQD08022.1 heme peroxidase superfamily protein [Mycolicibacterium conceptionense]